ncbi:DUF58 domain-containing protein [Octadecabacter sp. 1_MG-2023]|uniref:DUF58 domain-containing protein n=1 Tax=unclassified Octadecabacter TaxID=196158 RepID=UPI001C08AFDF|nr:MULTISPECIES: DUF58 domain-containing protein [unclassified Octadecabacter]MBU2994322.1 DUF58 domain-containing protein [Octadecabacter sp. B2R22]MDO6734389.1 DUF58 domain-containing protein [Octadecabacter sp. 1_MG-2023]
MSDAPLSLRSRSEDLAAPFPALLAEAEHLAATVMVGDHGRRRAGAGDTFWQYRPAQNHDEMRAIDWRRSARSDNQFVQDKEWQIAQSILLWVDQSASMSFTSLKDGTTKAQRARTLALATAILLLRGGERVGLTGNLLPPRRGEMQISQMAALLSEDHADDFGTPIADGMAPHSRALFVSDFLGDLTGIETAMAKAADRDVRGALVQILDPIEEAFPFDGRTIFESMTGAVVHETLKARDLRDRYLDRLAERKDRLAILARTSGWQFHTHHTDAAASSALLWTYSALERRP